VLDPQRSRKDLEPWSRAAGGMTDDALDEIELAKKLGKKLDEPTAAAAEPVVKVRCRGCSALNDEKAKFCSQCGAAM
jgi:rRNA maturation endonuclease Nob1